MIACRWPYSSLSYVININARMDASQSNHTLYNLIIHNVLNIILIHLNWVRFHDTITDFISSTIDIRSYILLGSLTCISPNGLFQSLQLALCDFHSFPFCKKCKTRRQGTVLYRERINKCLYLFILAYTKYKELILYSLRTWRVLRVCVY